MEIGHREALEESNKQLIAQNIKLRWNRKRVDKLNISLSLENKEKRARIKCLESRTEVQREGLKISHDEADKLRKDLQMLQT